MKKKIITLHYALLPTISRLVLLVLRYVLPGDALNRPERPPLQFASSLNINTIKEGTMKRLIWFYSTMVLQNKHAQNTAM